MLEELCAHCRCLRDKSHCKTVDRMGEGEERLRLGLFLSTRRSESTVRETLHISPFPAYSQNYKSQVPTMRFGAPRICLTSGSISLPRLAV